MQLAIICDLVRYYEMVGRVITVDNIRWNPVIKNFKKQWESLKKREKDENSIETPKISKSLPIIKWSEAFIDFLNRVIGTRMVSLAHFMRDDVVPGTPLPALAANSPHSEACSSIEAEIVSRVSHADPLCRDDNAKVYYYLEEATRGTLYAVSIKSYQRGKNGRDA